MKEAYRSIGLASAGVSAVFAALYSFHYTAFNRLQNKNPENLPYLSDAIMADGGGVVGQPYFNDGIPGRWYSFKLPDDMTAYELKSAMLMDAVGIGVCLVVAITSVVLYNRKS